MKTRIQKYMIMLACVFLTASFFILPVNAAMESADGMAQSDIVNISRQQGASSSFFRVYSRSDDVNPFRSADLSTWDNLASIQSNVTGSLVPFTNPDTGVENEAALFSFNLPSASPAVAACSYVFAGEQYLFEGMDYNAALDVSKRVFLNDGSLYVFNQLSANFVNSVRFSLRSVDDNLNIGPVIAYTDVYSLSFSDDGFLKFTDTRPYNLQFNFSSEPTSKYYLCVDFLITSNGVSSSGEIGLCSFDLRMYRFGSDSAAGNYYPELLNPLYKNPNMQTPEDVLSAEDELFRQLDEYNSNFDTILNNFSSGLSSFSVFFNRVYSVFGYMGNEIPFLNYVVFFSLALGLFGFVFGFANSAIGAAHDHRVMQDEKRKADEEANRRYVHSQLQLDLNFLRHNEKKQREIELSRPRLPRHDGRDSDY